MQDFQFISVHVDHVGLKIIAAGPWVGRDGSWERRVVLRFYGNEYVVHTQSAVNGCHDGFDSGNYFSLRHHDSPEKAAFAALDAFAEAVKSLGISHIATVTKIAKELNNG